MIQHLSMVALVAAVFAGCGDDDDEDTFDARPGTDAPITFDARPADAAPVFDARQPDAQSADAAPTFSGTLALHDIRIFGLAAAGHGVQATIDFNENGKEVEERYTVPSSFPACTATRVDVTKTAQANPTVNEGTVTVTRNGTAIAAPCNFSNGEYLCIFGGGASGTITQSTTNPAVGTFSNTSFTFAEAHVGAYLIEAATPANAWPIVGFSGMTAGLQSRGAAFPSSVGQFIVAYGVGPIAFTDTPAGTASPGAPPDLMADSDQFVLQLTPGGGNHFAAYTSSTINAGDDFELDAATTAVFQNGLDIYSDTSTELGCDDTECPTGSALVTVVSIETTDEEGGGPTDLATPTQYRATVTCPALGGNRVTITPAIKQVLRRANPKKMRISIFRDGGDTAALSRNLSVVAGHGWVVFKDVPPPPQ